MLKKETNNNLLKILISEKRFDPQKLNDILSADLYEIIKNYFDIEPLDVHTKVDLENDGYYVLRCKVRAKRVKIFGVLQGWCMKLKSLYFFVLSVVISFIVLFTGDFFGEYNPIKIVCNEISKIIYNRGAQ